MPANKPAAIDLTTNAATYTAASACIRAFIAIEPAGTTVTASGSHSSPGITPIEVEPGTAELLEYRAGGVGGAGLSYVNTGDFHERVLRIASSDPSMYFDGQSNPTQPFTLEFICSNTASGVFGFTGGAIPANTSLTHHHYSVVSNTVEHFENGVSQGTFGYSGFAALFNFSSGGDIDLSSILLYDRALTTAEIADSVAEPYAVPGATLTGGPLTIDVGVADADAAGLGVDIATQSALTTSVGTADADAAGLGVDIAAQAALGLTVGVADADAAGLGVDLATTGLGFDVGAAEGQAAALGVDLSSAPLTVDVGAAETQAAGLGVDIAAQPSLTLDVGAADADAAGLGVDLATISPDALSPGVAEAQAAGLGVDIAAQSALVLDVGVAEAQAAGLGVDLALGTPLTLDVGVAEAQAFALGVGLNEPVVEPPAVVRRPGGSAKRSRQRRRVITITPERQDTLDPKDEELLVLLAAIL